MSTDMVDLASAGLGDSVATDSGASTDSSSTSTEVNTDSAAVETNVDGAEQSAAGDEGGETGTHNADGSEKTPEEQEAFKTASAQKSTSAKDTLPQDARNALKALRDLDEGKYAKVAKTLHSAFERFEAVKPLLGSSGVTGLKQLLDASGSKDIAALSEAFVQQSASIEAVKSTDELLYAGDPKLWENVVEDINASGHPECLGKLAGSFIQALKSHDINAFYSEISRPTTLAGLTESGFPEALNKAFAAIDSDPKAAKAVLSAIGSWFTELRDSQSDATKISEERRKWNEEREAAGKVEQTKATKEYENSVAESADKYNNVSLGKQFGAFLKLPYFKDFPYESKVLIGNQIKDRLYSDLKANKAYQTTMTSLWKSKPTPENKAKMLSYHKAQVDGIASEVVRSTIQRMYPGYAKGGSAAGRAAAATDKKSADSRAASNSITSGKPIYVATRPSNLVREDITVGGKAYTPSDLQTLQIMGRGFVKSGDGKTFKFITWRK